MKILTIVPDLGIGGTQRVALNLSLGLKALGADVAVLAYAGGGAREHAYQEGKIQIFRSYSNYGSNAGIIAAERWKPDIVHIHRSGYANAKETQILRQLRGNNTKVVETNVFARFDWTEGGRLIDAHLLLSKWCSFKWHSWGGSLASRKLSYIVPNAVDARSIKTGTREDRIHIRKELGIPQGRFIFGRVGQPAPEKWSNKIYDVFRNVLERGNDVGLLLVGAPPQLLSILDSLSAEVRARIISLPTTPCDLRLSHYFAAMDGFLHLSTIGESFGMVLCEAMLSGVPIVTLSTPLKDNSQLEVVGHEQGGLVALDIDSVPDAMIRLIQDVPLREAVQIKGRNWVDTRFGVSQISKKVAGIYERLILPEQNDKNIIADAPPDREWIKDILSKGVGGQMRPGSRIAFSLIHKPLIYRLYQKIINLSKSG